MGRIGSTVLGALALAVLLGAPALAQMAGPASVAGLASELSPAVVNIGTSRPMPAGRGTPFPGFPQGSPLEDMFDRLNPNSGLGPDRMAEARSLGSGFIVSADGFVVTNNHVVEGASEIYVDLTDGRRLPAEIVGTDPKTDLAVIRIEADTEFAFVELGDSDALQVGDWVMAIGNPFGLGGSVSLGIVSARNRDIQSGPYDNFIQTDAAINQGNSGGPLFDMNGQVVGINTAIIARGGTSLGIGFAVPVNLARGVVDQLAEFGETRRGWLGVGIQEVTADIALSLARENTNGVIVVDIDPRGPSFAVLEEGDLILTFDGKTVLRMRDLPRIVAETQVGAAIAVEILRGGEPLTLDITLGRLEEIRDVAALAEAEPVVAPSPELLSNRSLSDLIGFTVAPLDAGQRAAFGIEGLSGVVITEVAPDSDADEKGFIAGLVIDEVDQTAIASVADLEALVADATEAERQAMLFKITDPAGSSRFIAVRLE